MSMVMNVSTRRDFKTFSNVLCVWLCHRWTVGYTPFPEVDDVAECARGRVVFEVVQAPERGGRLPVLTLVGNSRALTRDGVRFLTLCSPSPTECESSLV